MSTGGSASQGEAIAGMGLTIGLTIGGPIGRIIGRIIGLITGVALGCRCPPYRCCS